MLQARGNSWGAGEGHSWKEAHTLGAVMCPSCICMLFIRKWSLCQVHPDVPSGCGQHCTCMFYFCKTANPVGGRTGDAAEIVGLGGALGKPVRQARAGSRGSAWETRRGTCSACMSLGVRLRRRVLTANPLRHWSATECLSSSM